MPTGYTAALHDGKDITFTQFALTCVRAMGVTIMQRDDPLDSPLETEREPSPFTRDRLIELKAKLAEQKARSLKDWAADERENRQNVNAAVAASIQIAAERLARYKEMLGHVEAWTPPTEEHENFKKFMTDQLTESIKFDCDTRYQKTQERRSAEEFRDVTIAETERTVAYYEEEWAKEQERTESRNKWIRDFLESLPTPAPAEAIINLKEKNV